CGETMTTQKNDSTNHLPAVLQVKRLRETGVLPVRLTQGSIGYDLSVIEDRLIPAHGRAAVPLGISIRVPDGTYGRIAPRSELAMRGIDVGAGVIDPDFAGEIAVIFYNHSFEDYTFKAGERIAQLILEQALVVPVVLEEAPGECCLIVEPKPRKRGAMGFGSTGR
ncbi:hypothetical protein BOX15_Mlig017056g2, partial [Macrostomum lignano]